MRRVALLALAFFLFAPSALGADNELAPYPPPVPKEVPRPDGSFSWAEPQQRPTFGWFVTQLVPSPQLAFDRDANTAFGLRWQVTPALWSWGSHRRITGWRFFIVDPLARHSGSLAFETHIDWFGGHVDRLFARPALKATFPLLHRGEYLSFSLGTSVYRFDDKAHVAYDAGIYTLAGFLGLQATYAPYHAPITAIATLRIRYF
jgi:hypothetical protein